MRVQALPRRVSFAQAPAQAREVARGREFEVQTMLTRTVIPVLSAGLLLAGVIVAQDKKPTDAKARPKAFDSFSWSKGCAGAARAPAGAARASSGQ